MDLYAFGCHVVFVVDTVLVGRDVLKTLGLDPLTVLESRRATGEIKEIEFPYMSPIADTPDNEEKRLVTSCRTATMRRYTPAHFHSMHSQVRSWRILDMSNEIQEIGAVPHSWSCRNQCRAMNSEAFQSGMF
jgi:hypothetical protein